MFSVWMLSFFDAWLKCPLLRFGVWPRARYQTHHQPPPHETQAVQAIQPKAVLFPSFRLVNVSKFIKSRASIK